MRYADFYTRYLDIEDPKAEGFSKCFCPLHDDVQKESAGVDLKTGIFNCFVCGTFTPVRFLLKTFPEMKPTEASSIVDEFRREHGLVEKHPSFSTSRVPDPRWQKVWEIADKVDLRTVPQAVEYAEGRGLKIETLEECGVGWVEAGETSWRRDSLVFPYTIDGDIVGLRYRDLEGSKGGEPGCHFTLWGIDELNEGDVAIVCEGESDRMRAYQELGDEYPVVSTPTAAFRREWEREFEGYGKVILIPQADEAAASMVEATKIALGGKVEVLHLPWRRRQIGKDLCDWLSYNTGEELRTLVRTLAGDASRRVLSGRELLVYASSDREWLIKGLLCRRQICVLAGQPKSFKTWLMLSIVRCLLDPGSELCGIPGYESEEGDLKVLIVEEEGDVAGLAQRAVSTLEGIDWLDSTHWAHHLGVKLDEEGWVRRLEGEIERTGTDVLFLDPLRLIHSLDENSASEMSVLWSNIHRLTTRFPRLTVVVIHHFNKTGVSWAGVRGSSTTAAIADLGIFVQKVGQTGMKMSVDGRDVAPGSFKLQFRPETGLLSMNGETTVAAKSKEFLDELRTRKKWDVTVAAREHGVTTATIYNWLKKLPEGAHHIQGSAPGRPACILYHGDE